jgi:hypothetical protein
MMCPHKWTRHFLLKLVAHLNNLLTLLNCDFVCMERLLDCLGGLLFMSQNLLKHLNVLLFLMKHLAILLIALLCLLDQLLRCLTASVKLAHSLGLL